MKRRGAPSRPPRRSKRAEGLPAAGGTVKLRTERKSRHPWIFRKMVEPARIRPGSVVTVVERNGRPVGRGFYNPDSEITVRLLTTDPQAAVDQAFVAGRIAQARRLREDVLRLPAKTTAWRLLHGENDGCSGLIIDRFGDHLLVQCHALGWHLLRETVEAALAESFPGDTILWRSDPRAAKRDHFPVVPVRPASTVIHEGGLEFEVDLAGGHKTGFFCDQRENRMALRDFVLGRRVLDACCYTGGFALNAACAGAQSVTAVDLDEAALAVARRNGERNRAQVDWVHADAFDFFRDAEPGRYDVVIADPPGWGKVKAELSKAVRQYTDLNRYAIQALAPGGLLVSCCCAGLVSEATFVGALKYAAAEAGRELQLLRTTGAGADHPVLLDFPEGRYLSVVWALVS